MVRVQETMKSEFPGLGDEFYWEAFFLIVAVSAWMICRIYPNLKRKGKAPAGERSDGARVAEKDKEEISSDPEELANLLLHASDRQRSRALDLYRRSRSKINWTKISDEDKQRVFFNLCLAAARLGRNELLNGLLRDMEMLQVPRTLNIYMALLKMMTAKREFQDALSLWKRMRNEKIKVTDRVVWSCLLYAATEERMSDLSLFFYGELRKIGEPSDKDFSNVIRLHLNRRECDLAVAVLEEMDQRGLVPDNITYNMVFAACCSGGKYLDLADRLFRSKMKAAQACVDSVTYNTFMKGCVQASRLDDAFALLGEMEADGHTPTQFSFGTLLDACVNEGAMDRAHLLFQRMTQVGCEMNTVLYTTLIKGFVKSKSPEKVLEVWAEMRRQGVDPDTRTFSLILKALCDAGRMEEALEFFEKLCAVTHEKDEILFNNLLSGCIVRKNLALGEKLLADMLQLNIQPSCATISTLMKLYVECDALPQAQELLASMEQRFGMMPEQRLFTQLVHASMRLRHPVVSVEVFQAMVKRHGPPINSEFAKTLTTATSYNLFDPALEIVGTMLRGGGVVKDEQLQGLMDAAVRKRRAGVVEALVQLAEKHGRCVRVPV